MEQYIKSALGYDIILEKYDIPKNIPRYLIDGYSYNKYTIEGQDCLFVAPADFSLAGYKKHYEKIKQLTGMFPVLELKSITPYQRKALIEQHIPFVVQDYQIYLPFLAIALTEKYKKKQEIVKFTPITQLVFLYLFYNNVKLTATDIAVNFNCTAMSVTRAYKALTDCGLFSYECDGRKKYIVANYKGGDLLRAAEEYLVSPKEKSVLVPYGTKTDGMTVSGLYALGEKTMLAVTDRDKCFAIPKSEDLAVNSDLEDGILIEQWKYDPAILAQNGIVDDISLILSLKDSADERVQAELDELRRNYEW